ncbi:MAG: response regulator [Fibrobacterota bacterium]
MKNIIGILLLLGVSGTVFTSGAVELKDVTFFLNGDALSYDWEPLPVRKEGIYSISGRFSIDSAKNQYALVLPPVPYPVNIYVNSSFLYQRGDLDKTECLANFSPRVIHFNTHDLKQNNTFEIIFYTDGQRVAFPRIKILARDTAETRGAIQNILNSVIVQLISINSFFIGVIFLVLSFFTINQTGKYRALAGLSLCVALAYLPFLLNYSSAPELLLTKISKTSFVLVAYFLFILTNKIYAVTVHRYITYFILILIASAAVWIFMQPDKIGVNDIFGIYSLVLMLPLLLYAFMLILGRLKHQHSFDNSILAVGVGIMLLTSITDIYYVNNYLEPFFWTAPYGYLAIVIAASVVMMVHHKEETRRVELQRNEIEQTSHKLENSNMMLLESTRKLEELSRARKKFIKSISHEIRTPINGIASSVSFLQNIEFPDNSVDEYLQILTVSYYNLTILFRNIRDYANFDEPIYLENHKYDLVTSLKTVLNYVDAVARQKGLTFIEDVPFDDFPRRVYGDEKRAAQVLLNILSNAVKFTQHGSISFHAEYRNNTLFAEITDTGVGIRESQRKSIYEAFRHYDNINSSEKFSNIGLGLSITLKIVKTMNGTISFKSRENYGTSFYISIPLPQRTYEPAQISRSSQAHILVAEDNPLNRKLIEMQLGKLNFSTTLVNNGREAVKASRDFSYDLILLDIQMPVMNGMEAAQEIRRLHPGVPIIAWTANAEVKECIDAGFDGFLSKPASRESIYHEILDRLS